MRLPSQATAVTRGVGTHAVTNAMNPSGCDFFKAAACATALVACGAVCIGSVGTACVQCLAAIGAAGCIDCVS